MCASMATMTPQQAAQLHPQDPRRWDWIFDEQTSLLVLNEFFRIKSYNWIVAGERDATVNAIQIRIALEQAKSANLLHTETGKLISQVGALTSIAEEQRELAKKLDEQTDTLIKLTWVLAGLTAALLIKEIVSLCVSGKG
jgi:hypothetical protein